MGEENRLWELGDQEKGADMNTMSMMRGVRTLATLRGGSRPLIQSFAGSSSKSGNGVVAAGAAPDLAAGEDLLLEEEESPAVVVAAKKRLTTPSLLQPGVVIYDGVCHLCHTGTFTYQSILF